MEEKQLTIVVMGRNQTKKLSEITSFFIKEKWNDRLFPCVLVTQTEAPVKHYYDDIIYTEENAIWGERLEVALERIQSKYIFLSQEDFFPSSIIKNDQINECIKYMNQNEKIAAIRLNNFAFFKSKYDDKYDVILKDMPYRICGQPTIFRKEYLTKLAKKRYNPWQFEIEGSEYSSQLEGEILISKRNLYPYIHAWTKGSWTRQAVQLMKKYDIEKNIYCNDKVYPLYKEVINFIWGIAFRLFPNFFTNLTKKRDRAN